MVNSTKPVLVKFCYLIMALRMTKSLRIRHLYQLALRE